MKSDRELIDGIAEVIQRIYGDATQTALDRQCAREIWQYLADQGTASPQFVAAMVASAGGSLLVEERHQVDPPRALTVFREGLGALRVTMRP